MFKKIYEASEFLDRRHVHCKYFNVCTPDSNLITVISVEILGCTIRSICKFRRDVPCFASRTRNV
ncbi:hypothetical protein PUN28_010599 [Cardiocondyla obscurior]|uniref:Uncharacterized protein n=1 Tax=Cardiocondyla obscurior TaxID=286306 RepID=A0AAW2FJ70_9HYME